MSEESKERAPKKKTAWVPDRKITMTIRKGDLWTVDTNLKMKIQEGLEKKKKKTQ